MYLSQYFHLCSLFRLHQACGVFSSKPRETHVISSQLCDNSLHTCYIVKSFGQACQQVVSCAQLVSKMLVLSMCCHKHLVYILVYSLDVGRGVKDFFHNIFLYYENYTANSMRYPKFLGVHAVDMCIKP